MEARFELFDHTADLGVRVVAPSLAELLHAAGEGLYAVLGELHPEGKTQADHFLFRGGDRAELLRDYLAELLLIFERDHRMVTDLKMEVFEPDRLEVTAETRAVSWSQSVFDREIKAVTYHGLELKAVDDGYQLEYIVDI